MSCVYAVLKYDKGLLLRNKVKHGQWQHLSENQNTYLKRRVLELTLGVKLSACHKRDSVHGPWDCPKKY